MMNFLTTLDNLEIEELSRGICSEMNIYKAKYGDREISAVYFYHIIRRLYLSPERFQLMIDMDEYRYFSWIYDVKCAVAACDYEKLTELVSENNIKKLEEYDSVVAHDAAVIQGILYAEVKKDRESAYRAFKKAVNYMTAPDLTLLPGRYGIEEINRFMNYLRISAETKHMTKEQIKSEFDRIFRIAELQERDPREEAKLYPRITCFMLNTVGELVPNEIQKKRLMKALSCLQRTWECYDLPELLRLLIIACRNLEDPETERYVHWYEAVCTAFDTAGYNTDFDYFDSHDGACQLYLIHDYLKRSRINAKDENGKRMTQEKVSEFVMDPANYSRVEAGKHRPRKQHYEELTRRMGVRSDLYRGEIITNDPNDFTLMTEIRRAANERDTERLSTYLKMLSESLDKSYIENVQFLDQKQAILEMLTGKITIEESVQRLIGILEYTVGYKPDENHVYSYLEGEMIYMIVRNKRVCRMLNSEDVEILKSYLKSEEKSKALFWTRTGLNKRLLAGILQTQGIFEEAEILSRECLTDMIKVQDAGLVVDCLDILAESILEKDRLYAKKLIKAAYWLCDLYHDERNKRSMDRYYSKVYNEDVTL